MNIFLARQNYKLQGKPQGREGSLIYRPREEHFMSRLGLYRRLSLWELRTLTKLFLKKNNNNSIIDQDSRYWNVVKTGNILSTNNDGLVTFVFNYLSVIFILLLFLSKIVSNLSVTDRSNE